MSFGDEITQYGPQINGLWSHGKTTKGTNPTPTPQLGPHTRVIREKARDVYLFRGKKRNCLLISLWFQLRQKLWYWQMGSRHQWAKPQVNLGLCLSLLERFTGDHCHEFMNNTWENTQKSNCFLCREISSGETQDLLLIGHWAVSPSPAQQTLSYSWNVSHYYLWENCPIRIQSQGTSDGLCKSHATWQGSRGGGLRSLGGRGQGTGSARSRPQR